jgi:pimeloyl-ACP methyl ester carboxylesterase
VSSITTDQGILHYEVYGRGRPVIFLHGWLGSVELWRDTMTYLGQYYRTYSIDFWGFGESGKKQETYAVHDFVGMVDQFMEQLGIVSAPLVGHSMGGTVSLSVALKYPQRVQQVTVIGSPINGNSLSLLLKMAGYQWVAGLVFNFFDIFRWIMYHIYSPIVCRHPDFPDMMDKDLSKTILDSFLTSIHTLRKTDLSARLHEINIPVMGMYGNRDVIVSPRQWKLLKRGAPQTRVERFPKAGHFIMLDEAEAFRETLKDFLDNNDPRPRQ